MLIDSKETQNQPQVNDTQGTQNPSRTTKRRQKKYVNKRFRRKGTRNDDTSQIKSKGSEETKTKQDLFIREIKLIHSKNVHYCYWN